MAAEFTAVFSDFPDSRKTEYLESSAVGEYGTVEGVETVYAAGGFEHGKARTEIEMIGVAKDNLGFDVLGQFVQVDALHGTHRTNGHEDGSEDVTMVGMQYAGACI